MQRWGNQGDSRLDSAINYDKCAERMMAEPLFGKWLFLIKYV